MSEQLMAETKASAEQKASEPTFGEVQDLTNRFTYHEPRPGQPVLYNAIRATALRFATLLTALMPPGRERSLAVTHLEEAVFWANAGIARTGAAASPIAVNIAASEAVNANRVVGEGVR